MLTLALRLSLWPNLIPPQLYKHSFVVSSSVYDIFSIAASPALGVAGSLRLP